MGDDSDREVGFGSLTYHNNQSAFAAGLRQSFTETIRFADRASGRRKVYRNVFIAGLQDLCILFEGA